MLQEGNLAYKTEGTFPFLMSNTHPYRSVLREEQVNKIHQSQHTWIWYKSVKRCGWCAITFVLEENIPAEITGHSHDLEANMIGNFKVQEKSANFSLKRITKLLTHI